SFSESTKQLYYRAFTERSEIDSGKWRTNVALDLQTQFLF
ncbi:unnamed protein product, partial [Allacma fusca]